ncbi:hypothetical protein [Halorubrum sp. 2020YC2]|uniref:hypothetical protein n=1 Tax=Halorubrum sp. 2020YC2 TaxID=2836432 RepID=UPI001BEAFBA3|nr:hypothetical protein [Halorubrum sp. 2020YC2]QWC20537.1 hypothetical protein KI388_06235 [Halorubrum sp. 2020YC2]
MSGADGGRSRGGRSGPRTPGGAWTPFLAGVAVVLVASLLPVPDGFVGSGGASGGAAVGPLAALGPTGPFHLIGYAGLAALATRATSRALAAGASVAVGFCVELLQSQVAWRSFAWTDAAVNAVGAAVGVAGVWTLVALRRRGDRGDRGGRDADGERR